MRKNKNQIRTYNIIMINVFLRCLLLLSFTATSHASSLSDYKRLAQDTIAKVQNSGIGDIDQLIDQQSKLVQLGVKACEEYASKHPTAKPVLHLVISNAESMKQLSLDEIEEKWHKGGELKKYGYTVKEDHFGDVGNLIDAVIHPATSYIALNYYKTSGDNSHLQQVVAELSEVLVHLQHLE